MADYAELRELAERAQASLGDFAGPWEVGGPYPGTSVITMVDGGQGWPEPEPPIYEPICVLDQRTEGEPNKAARWLAGYIAAVDPQTVIGLLESIEAWRAENTRHMREAENMASQVQEYRRQRDGLLHAIKGRLERTEVLIALGKGEWPDKNYVKDEQWSSWQHEVLTLKGILFAADHYNPEADAALAAAKTAPAQQPASEERLAAEPY